jgi:V-type H+-transporting ATPase subunit d
LNSFDTELSQDNRAKLYPNIGLLYPEGKNKLSVADKPEDVKSAIEHVEV